MLSPYERETYFSFNEAEKEAVVFTYNASLIRKLKNAMEEHAEINLVKDNPLSASKDEIQEYFSFAFECVGGEMEKYYDKWPEMIRLINLTVSPDPIDGADAGILEGGI